MDKYQRMQVRQQLYDYINTVIYPQYPTLFEVEGMREVIYHTFVGMQLGRMQISAREGQPLEIDDLCRGIKQSMFQYYADYKIEVENDE